MLRIRFGVYYIMSPDYLNWIYDVDNDMEDLFGLSFTPLEDVIKEIIEAPNYFS